MAIVKRRAKKITKQDIKEDKFVTSVVKGTAYASENVRSVVLMAVALVLVVMGVLVWRYYRAKRVEGAETRLGIAQIAYSIGQFMECKDTLLSLVNNYGGTKQAKVAMFLLGHIYYGTGMPDSAEVYWKGFLESKFKDNDMRAGAMMGIASVLSDRNQFEEAGQAFEKCYEEFPDYVDRGDFLLKSAENYKEAGQSEKAISLLEKYIREYEKSSKIQTAKLLLAELKAR